MKKNKNSKRLKIIVALCAKIFRKICLDLSVHEIYMLSIYRKKSKTTLYLKKL